MYVKVGGDDAEAAAASQPHDSRVVRVKRLKPGDQFGYDALLGTSHDTTVACLTDASLTVVPQARP